MPNWKKLIVSGSDALLNSLNVSNDLTVSGDIAVGSSPPSSAALGVDGNIKGTGYILLNSSVNEFIYATPTGKAVEIWATSSNASGDPAFRIRQDSAAKVDFGWDDDGTSEAFVWNYSNGGFKIGTNNAERLKITADGKIGIGTSSPTFKLDVETSDDLVASFVSTDNKAAISISDDDTTGYFSAENGRVGFGTGLGASSANISILTSNSNVGIGTVSPTKKLQVVGDISGSDVYINGWNSVSASLSTHAQALVNNINGSGTADYVARFSDADTLTTGVIRDDGSTVGINAAPSAVRTLYIDGTIQATGEAFFKNFDIIGTNGSTSRFRDDVLLRFGTDRIFGLQYNSTADQLQFVSSSLPLITLSGDGDVVIPSGSLSISGDGVNTVTLTESGNGDFTIDAPDDIRLDAGGGDVVLRANGVEYGRFGNYSSGNLGIRNVTQDKDIIFKGNDGGTTIDALTLDMSAKGKATFSGNGIFTDQLTINAPDDGGSPANTSILHLKGYEGRGAGIRIQDSKNSASNPSNREWFIGSGYGQSAFNIGYAADGSQSSYAAQNFLKITTSGDTTFAGATTSTKVNINQAADAQGLEISGYDDHSSSNVKLNVNSSGHARLSQTTNGGSGYLFLEAENYLNLQAGTLVYTSNQFRIYDAGSITFGSGGDFRASYNSTADEFRLVETTGGSKGMKMDTDGKVTFTEDLVVEGTLTAQELHTEFVSASIIYKSGSTKFGDTVDDNHDFTGSINLLAQSGASGLDIKRGTNIYMNLNNSSTRNEINFKSSQGLRFFHGTDSTSPLFISSSGEVGVGTTAPIRTFHVEKATTYPGRFAYNSTNYLDIGYDSLNVKGGSLLFRNDGTEHLRINTTGALKAALYGSGNHTGTLAYSLGVDSSGNIIEFTGGSGGGTVSSITAGADNRVAVFNGSDSLEGDADFTFDGTNVGIGVSSPAYKLDIRNATNTGINISGTSSFIRWNAGDMQIKNAGSYAMAFDTWTGSALTEKMRITSDGKVGIGTTSPNEKLHVEGTSRFGGDMHFGSAVSGLVYRPVEGGSAIDRYFLMFDETDDASFPFLTNRTPNGAVVIKTGTAAGSNENEHFRIKGGDGTVDAYFTNVKLGIGTSSPTKDLVVNSNTGGQIQTQYQGTDKFRMQADSGGGSFYSVSGAYTRFHTSGVERLRITSDGKVGIGTTSPLYPLQVVGSAYVNAGSLFIDSGNRLKWGNSNQFIEGTNDTSLEFGTGGSTKMLLNNSGNLGIGTTAPARSLHVVSTADQLAQFESSDASAKIEIKDNTTSAYINANSANASFGPFSSYTDSGNIRIFSGSVDHTGNGVGAFGGAPSTNTKWKVVSTVDTSADTGFNNTVIDLNVQGSTAVTNDRSYRGLYIDLDSSATGGDTADEVRLYGQYVSIVDSGDADLNHGIEVHTENRNSDASATMNMLLGLRATAKAANTEGTISNMYGVDGQVNMGSTTGGDIGTVVGVRGNVTGGNTNKTPSNIHAGFFKVDPGANFASTIGTTRGVFSEIEIDGNTTSTNLRAIEGVIDINSGSHNDIYQLKLHTDIHSNATHTGQNYGIFSQGTERHFLQGKTLIGSTNAGAPGAELHIYSTGSGLVGISIQNADTSFDNNTSSDGLSIGVNGNDAYFVNRESADIYFYTNDTNTNGITIKSGGNVGIGTTTPQRTLDVNGEIQNNGIFRKGGNVIIKSTGSETMFGPGGSGIITFHNSATMTTSDETMRIDSSGNVLINNTSGNARLDVRQDTGDIIRAENASGQVFAVSSSGDVDISGDLVVAGTLTAQEFHTEFVSASIIYDSGSTKFGDTQDDVHNFTGSLKTSGSIFQYGDTYNIEIGAGSVVRGSNHLQVEAQNSYLNVMAPNNSIYYRAGGNHVFRNGNGSSTYMTIDTSGGGEGNVGIGTTAPSYNLTVYNDSLTDSFPIVAGSGVSAGEFVGIGLSGFVASNGAVKAGMVLDRVGNYGTGDIHFLNNSTEDNSDATLSDSKLVIKEDGKVGIGTTAPSQKFEVLGNIKAGAGAADNYLQAVHSDGASARLHGYGLYHGRTDNYIRPTTDANKKMHFGTQNHQWSELNIDSTLVRFYTNGTENARITSTGNIGIGTAAPGAKLEVAGDTKLNGDLDFSGGTAKKIKTGSQRGYTLPAQGTRMRILTIEDGTSCRVYLDSSENSYNQPIVLEIFYRAQFTTSKPIIRRLDNYQWHTHSNDIIFTSDTAGTVGADSHIYAEKVNYSTGRSVNIRKVEEFKGSVTILDGSTTDTNGGTDETIKDAVFSDVSIDDWGSVSASLSAIQTAGGVNGTGQAARIAIWSDSDTLTSDSNLYWGSSNDRLGIKVTNPTENLQVNGTAGFGSNMSTNAVKITVNQASTFPGSNTSTSRFVDFIGSNSGQNTEIGGIRWLNTDSDNGNYQYHAAGITSHNGGSSNDGDLRFFVSSNASADSSTGVIEAVRIATDGNVGIGTTTPAEKLTVEGSISASGDLTLTDANPSIILTDTNSNSDFSINVNGGVFNIKDETNSLARISLKSNGNVGIGTTNPDEKLHVMYAHADGTATTYARAIIEDTDAQLDLLSTSAGTWGSSINLVEAAGSGANTDVWAMARKTTGGSGDSSLNFNFGTNNLHSNTTRVSFSSTGNIYMQGDLTISSAKIKYQQNTDVDSAAAETIASVDTGSFAGAFFDYTCVSGSNARAGTVMAVNVNGSVEFTDNSTKDIGNTSGVTLSVDISGGSMRLRATTTTDNWTIKSLVRAL